MAVDGQGRAVVGGYCHPTGSGNRNTFLAEFPR